MLRTKLQLPKTFTFSTEIPLRVGDINYGGHLGNDRILSLVHEARVRHLRRFGYTELDVEGAGMVVADAVIVYKSEAFYGDVVNISLTCADFHRYGCNYFYRLTNKQSGREIARAKTGMVFFDFQRRRMVPMPEPFRLLFA